MEFNNESEQGNYPYNSRDDMSVSTSHCSKFARRHDFSAFNMTNYQSCENCRNFTADNVCVTNTNNSNQWT